ncbi:MAG TPA: HAD hydrolase family protein [Candidatus Hydrogenedentes bacterium]|nr:HAD hydrolase family protein [Candidatus Hydrogenedentota bacterium]HPG65658.1 HAD hydrolase family protein [Candidatus Hydrogenedentota bacterium]
MAMKWIISDIDGCLSPEESVAWDLEAFGEFARRVRRNADGRGPQLPLTLCSGRPQPYLEVLAKALDIRATMICENGAVLYSLHDNWSRYGPGVTPEKILGVQAVRGFLETEILPSAPEVLLQFGKHAQVSVYSPRPEALEPIKQRVETFIAERGGPEFVLDISVYYLNVSLAGVNKGATLSALLGELDATRDEVVGIGDSVGDLPLREAVGFFACPANACDALKDVADYISPHRDVRGMLDILDHPALQRP